MNILDTIKEMWAELNETIDRFLPNVPNWIIWGILLYLILK